MDSVIKFEGSKNLSQLSPAHKNSLHDLVDFHEFIKYSQEYKAKEDFTCGPFYKSDEWNLLKNQGTQYHINEYGFRGKWDLTKSKKVRMAVFGDSCTFGIGVDEKDIYVSRLQEMFPSYAIYNFGMVGSSIDNIVKCYSVANRLMGFDKALFLLPDYSRFCWPKYEKEWKHTNMILGPGLDTTNPDHMAYIRNYWEELEVNRTINYLNWLEDISQIRNTKTSVWSWSRATNDLIRQVMSAESVAIISPEDIEVDHARDHQHPGPKTHRKISEFWFEQLVLGE